LAGARPPGSPVNINTADAGELDSLPGVGPTTAAAILDHRTQHGPFRSVDDLLKVRGIGRAKLDQMRALVTT
jgi:competence protein ComEA